MLSQGPFDTPTEHLAMSLGERLRTAEPPPGSTDAAGSTDVTGELPAVDAGAEPPAVGAGLAAAGVTAPRRQVSALPRRRPTPSPRPPADPLNTSLDDLLGGDSTAEFDPFQDDDDATGSVPTQAVAGADAEGSGPVADPRSGPRRTAVLASLVLVAALAGLVTGYAVMERMGGWDAIWVGTDHDSGDPGSGVGGAPEDDEVGQGAASASPSPSASASPSGSPSTTPSPGTRPTSPTPTDPDPAPTKPTESPKPTTTSPTPSPSDPQPTKSRPHP
ncbi:MAG: hypothetical protein ACRDTM_04135 [Micromonosporaceae bacterium]